MIEAVIFDLDGLLLDTERLGLEAGMETLALLGFPTPPSVFHKMIGLDVAASHKLICDWHKADFSVDEIFTPWNDARRARMMGGIPLRPTVEKTLAVLSELNLPCAVATNSLTNDALWKLEKAGLEGRFNAIVGRDQAGGSKPQPHVYLHAAKLLEKTPQSCLALEDSDVGVRAALSAGMCVVQIPDLVCPTANAAHHVADSLMAALEWAGIIENRVQA